MYRMVQGYVRAHRDRGGFGVEGGLELIYTVRVSNYKPYKP